MAESDRKEWMLGSEEAITLVADKWRLTILHALAPGPLRHGELQRLLGGISAKVLSQALRSLVRDGLVHREVWQVVPPRVDYSLTPLGTSLLRPLRELCHWTRDHRAQLSAARSRYDRKQKMASAAK